MSALRKLERGIVKNKMYRMSHNTKGFHDVWKKYVENKNNRKIKED